MCLCFQYTTVTVELEGSFLTLETEARQRKTVAVLVETAVMIFSLLHNIHQHTFFKKIFFYLVEL